MQIISTHSLMLTLLSRLFLFTLILSLKIRPSILVSNFISNTSRLLPSDVFDAHFWSKYYNWSHNALMHRFLSFYRHCFPPSIVSSKDSTFYFPSVVSALSFSLSMLFSFSLFLSFSSFFFSFLSLPFSFAFSFSISLLFLSRKREAVTQGGTRGIDHLT